MFRPILIFVLVSAAALFWWRASLYDRPHISNMDDLGVRGTVSGALPPSGYQPGHLLRDTLKNDKQHTPPYMDIGRYAYRQYLSAPRRERERVRRNLQRTVQPASQWLAWLDAEQFDFLCIGESHQENYRRYLSRHFFPNYGLDILFLEARLLPAKVMGVRAEIGEEDVALLNADIADIIRAVRARNPDVRIVGVEESSGQLSDRKGVRTGSRDQSLFDNVAENYERGRRSAALLGALHCTERWNWLYARLQRSQTDTQFSTLLNMRLMSESKDLLSREFSRFLSLIGYPDGDYAIVETDRLDNSIHDWFLELTKHFASYSALILFRDQRPTDG